MDHHRDALVGQALAGMDVDDRRTLARLLDQFLTGFEQALGVATAPGTPSDPDDGA